MIIKKKKLEVTAYPLKCTTGHQSLCFDRTVHQAPQVNRSFSWFEAHVNATSEVQQSLRYKTSVQVSVGATQPVKVILHVKYILQWTNKPLMNDSFGLLKLLMIKIIVTM